MKKLITAIIVIVAFAVPSIASANATTSYVQRTWTHGLIVRANLAGIRITATTFRCGSLGGSNYSCYATYTAYLNGVHAKYGEYINITPRRWYTVATPIRLAIW
jgi:hypothetical protein